MLAFPGICSIVVALVTSVWPALAMTRSSTDALMRGSRRGGVRRSRGAREVILAAQVALSMLLLVGSGLLVRSLLNLAAVDPGFTADSVLTFEITLPASSYPERIRGPIPAIRPRIIGAVDRVLENLRSDPRIAGAAMGKPLPLSGAQEVTVYVPEGVPLPPADRRPMTEYIVASDALFEVLGTHVVHGRGFTAADREGSQPWQS